MSDLGLKIGVEIHQQLDTHKLFCNCPSELRVDTPDITAKRRLYAVAGETGIIDAAAAYEELRKRVYFYEAYSDSTCNVELDEEPPHLINQEALEIAIQISLLLNAVIIPITQVMRKAVIDGSNPSGFQRTVIIAKDGFVDIGKKKISIPAIMLEEDSARRISETKDSVTFRLDRLGIPLIEISTSPDISNPEEAKNVALKIGEILRACKVKRGIGTIRQDINLSIKGGARTEIKGIQEPYLIPKVIENEIIRQQLLIKEKKKVEATVRNALPDGNTKFLRPLPGEARMYPETDLPLIYIKEEIIKKLKKNLPKLKDDILSELKKKISEEFANLLIKENKIEQFKELGSSDLAAKLLVLYPKEIASHEKINLEKVEKVLNISILKEVIKLVKDKKISESSVKEILTEIVKGKTLEEVISSLKPISKQEIEKEIWLLIKQKPDLSISAYMGILMQKFRGKIPGNELIEMIKKALK
ncbi:MAG: Glu-tRNA(Gln) amidotransferase subunit GatE [Candidatus Pacearchaeota archaeon]